MIKIIFIYKIYLFVKLLNKHLNVLMLWHCHWLYLHWKFKLWVGKFAWGVKAKHCWATNFWKQKRLLTSSNNILPHYLSPQVNFPTNNLNFWDQIQAIFLILFCFIKTLQDYFNMIDFKIWLMWFLTTYSQPINSSKKMLTIN